jgi:nicotinic acid phosphoribosyltransferase
MNDIDSILLTDLYELTMLEAWFTEGANESMRSRNNVLPMSG